MSLDIKMGSNIDEVVSTFRGIALFDVRSVVQGDDVCCFDEDDDSVVVGMMNGHSVCCSYEAEAVWNLDSLDEVVKQVKACLLPLSYRITESCFDGCG